MLFKISRFRALVMLLTLVSSRSVLLFAQISLDSQMDWATGMLKIEASAPLPEGVSPSDHPMALTALERKFPSLIADEIGRLVLDNTGTLNQQKSSDAGIRGRMETVAGKINREWSRISKDYSRVEASYLINLRESLSELIPVNPYRKPVDIPVGWTPIPNDPWTGLVIYAPNQLPLRGTGLTVDPVPALRARLISESLEVLLDPASDDAVHISYYLLDNRDAAEPWVGRRPYRVMARELYGVTPCDIIISDEDARRILASPSGREVLNAGRVVILVDSLPD